MSAPNPTWEQVVEFIKRRRDELIDDLDSLGGDEQSRRDAAVRRDELLNVLGCPGVIAAAEHQVETPKPRAQY